MKKVADLKKGDKVLLNYGLWGDRVVICDFDTYRKWQSKFKPWEGTVRSNDHLRGRNPDPTTINLMVRGLTEEGGSVYAHQVIGWFNPTSKIFEQIEHTDKQRQCQQMVKTVLGD